jgi:hypothetical protein
MRNSAKLMRDVEQNVMAFANDCGWSGPPLCWDKDRRFLLRCELDAAVFLLGATA